MLHSLVDYTRYSFEYLYEWLKIFLPEVLVRKLGNFIHIVERDFRYLLTASKAIRRVRQYAKENTTIVDGFKATLKKFPNKACFLFEDTEWTYNDVEDYANRISSVFGSFIEKGEVVAILLPNRPEYACIWLGCAKAGIISALINVNLRMKPLLHCLNVSKAKAIIYSDQYESALSEILNEVEGNPKLFSFEGGSIVTKSENLTKILKSADPEKRPARQVNFKDVILYIFTSGTTGMPKLANITHSKLLGISLAIEMIVGIKEDDIIYNPMTMYHAACNATVAFNFVRGSTLILRTKFSSSAFISDCIKYNATAAQYIGETLRYIVNTPVQPNERNHKLRLMSGNGVTADVWRKFVQRFNVPSIIEFYGSTEGNFLFVNNRNVVGSCGYLPIGIPFYYLLGPSIIKVNQETGQPLRNKYGRCILAEPNETGLCIGLCPPGNEMRKFHGYTNKADTESKIIRNVFKEGDLAFNTGDFLVMDERGWVTFMDRVGDTFRWKGENVSTTEVESILNGSPYVEDCAVYGVQVGSLEGKAGMAAVIMKKIDLEGFGRFLDLSLPSYARPLFLRLVDSLQHTTSFKVVKSKLKKEAFDISIITDPLLIRLNGKYTPLTKEIYEEVQGDKLKL